MRFSKRLRAALAGNALPEEETPLFTGGALKKLILPLIIEQTLTITVGMADTVMAVSYTHLDVYKRQVYTGRPRL